MLKWRVKDDMMLRRLSECERADHLEGAHTYLDKILTGRHDPQTVELFVIDVLCSQSDQKMTCSICI